ncbi:MAG: Gfo/Idh/MocA family oxidoreductase [Lentisphaeria bacterium]|nr:Gfo/Idh/MocA family oxidoreductase [Lentisphaeria bacterium]
MDKVRIGFIGCGGIAQYHFGHLEKIDEAEVVAVCDLIAEKAETASERFDATPYIRYEEMLKAEELDAVYVCVEPSAHTGMEFAVIEKGCHIFVEKPVALDLDYAGRVRDAIAEKALISGVGFQCRYAETLPRVKAWLAGQDIGMVAGFRLGGMPKVWWWRRKETSGGQVAEMSIHNFDLCRYLFGEVKAVQAMARRGIMTEVENYDTDDASSVTMMFESGVVCTYFSGCFSNGIGKSGMEVYTKKGKLEYSIGGAFKIIEPNLVIDGKAGNDYGQEEDDAFIDAVLTNDQSLVMSPYADAVKTLELVLGANESMDNGGKLVTLGQ